MKSDLPMLPIVFSSILQALNYHDAPLRKRQHPGMKTMRSITVRGNLLEPLLSLEAHNRARIRNRKESRECTSATSTYFATFKKFTTNKYGAKKNGWARRPFAAVSSRAPRPDFRPDSGLRTSPVTVVRASQKTT